MCVFWEGVRVRFGREGYEKDIPEGIGTEKFLRFEV